MAKLILNGEVVEMGSGGSDVTFDDTMTTNDEGVTSVTNPMRGILTQAEYDALPEEEKSVGTYVISDNQNGSGGGSSSAGEIYSTEETRIGTWIDGKPLYRRVYQFTGPTVVNVETMVLTLPSTFEAVDIRALMKITYGHRVTLPFTYNEGTIIGFFIGKDNNVYMQSSNPVYLNASVILTLMYTKTTD